ncbi:ABC transporter permease [Actinoplanes sp. SE50]|uniref:ABC transporter permease n=1 Tax=unclassified Actinoplanes TaxID=2626549 RepID=UPI00023ED2A9|nr:MULTISPECIES: FtsX-like permease family protein [unclassified Actinoplanes]AEV86143.1 Macrolide export ATP-binding/permease protein macB [Actinoplanes sp. SE50/110]ATO84541.1 ABC transporter permease [Actinoplanes sp. SE50]SLM01951.1 ABC transporter permease [Actinoplanes sp. SE50/110]
MLRATLKSLLARKLRLILSGLAVVLGVMFVSGSFVVTDTLDRTFDAIFADAFAATDVSVSAKPRVEVARMEGEQVAAPLPAATVDRIRTMAGVRSATGRVDADGARVIGGDGKVVTSSGPPRLGENWTGTDATMELRGGRGPQADDEIAVNATTAKLAGLRLGDRVGVLTLAPKKQFTLVGIWGYTGNRDSVGGAQEVAFTTPVAQRLMVGQAGAFTSVTVQAADGVTPDALRDRVAAALGDGYQVKTGRQLADESASSIKEGLKFFNRILLGFAGVALFVGIFLILNTFSIIVAQRTRELALLRAMGASRRQVIGSVLIEAVMIGLIASILGLAAGVGVGAALAGLFGRFADMTLAAIGVPLSAVLSAFTVGLLVTVVAAVLPALRASRIAPVAAMHQVSIPDRPLTRISVFGGVVLSAGAAMLGTGLFVSTSAPVTLWLILGGVLVSFIGVALLTPLLSRPVISVLGRIFAWSVPGRLGRLNSGRNPRRTAITAAALMVGIALVTGVTVVMDSAKSSLRAEAATVLKAQIMISGDQSGSRPPTYDQSVLQKITAIGGVRAAAGLWNDVASVDGKRQYVAGTTDLSRLAQAYGTTATALADDQIAVSRSTATDEHWPTGQRVTIQNSRGDPHTYTVTRIFADDTLPGSIILPGSRLADFGITQPVVGFVRLDDGVAVSSVLPQVKQLLADSPEVSATDAATFVDGQAAQFDQIITMIQILLGLAILIAVLGVVNTLALSVLERTRELGLLRAVGLGRAQTMRMITVEAVVISVFGALLGVAVGAGMGSAVARALRDDGITTIVLPWGRMGTYLVLAALVGVIAAVVPAIRAARLNVLGAIAHD